MRAAGDKNEAMVVFLLGKNASVNASDMWGGTPLIYAAISGSLPIVRTLLDHKADVNKRGNPGTTPLISACSYGRTEIAALLLAAGARIDAVQEGNGMTALMQAVHEHKHECVKLLLAKGADKSLKSRWGATALQLAQESHDAKSIALLSP